MFDEVNFNSREKEREKKKKLTVGETVLSRYLDENYSMCFAVLCWVYVFWIHLSIDAIAVNSNLCKFNKKIYWLTKMHLTFSPMYDDSKHTFSTDRTSKQASKRTKASASRFYFIYLLTIKHE